ncbi:MAG TPA: sn-glycerol-3-phosphate ABC transporter ATP-binding protein UgpC [Candidatus Dormibacteraeota bacterium]
MASVSFRHVTKRFRGGDVALNDVSLDVADGEFMVVVGPSGCGKSTLLRMLAGLEEIDQGEIWIGDRMINDVPTRNREVSMVFQDYALYPHLSAFDNMGFGLRMQGVALSEIAWRVSRAADILEIVPILDRKPAELSGGERQRVALGRAIVKNPRAFLLDEPLSSVDAKLRGHMRVELRKIHRRLRATFIYVTHDQVEAMTLGDRIAVLKDGQLQQVAPPTYVYDHPINLFVAGFIGTPAMNLIPVTVSGRKAKGSAIEIELPYPSHVDRAVLGIRPEAMTDRLDPRMPTIDVRVEMAESIGQHQLIYGVAGDDGIVARIDSRAHVSRGDRMRLGLDIRSVHLFDAQTGQAFM